MNRQYEDTKIDVGLVAQTLDNSNVTGKYHPLNEFRECMAVLSGGAMAKTKTTKIELLQATNAAAGSAKAVSGAEATVTANEDVTELTITLATVLNSETIVINDLTFTAHTDTTTVADREFKIDGTDTADAAALVVCINDPTYGVPGVTASNVAAVVTLVSTVPGAILISAVSGDATFTVATTKAQAYVSIDPLVLDGSGGFDHVAVKVTSTATGTVAAVLLRSKSRKVISQKVGANYPA